MYVCQSQNRNNRIQNCNRIWKLFIFNLLKWKYENFTRHMKVSKVGTFNRSISQFIYTRILSEVPRKVDTVQIFPAHHNSLRRLKTRIQTNIRAINYSKVTLLRQESFCFSLNLFSCLDILKRKSDEKKTSHFIVLSAKPFPIIGSFENFSN